MTMTDERLAELDAVMAKATAGEWGVWAEPCAHPSSAQQELVQQVEQTESFVGALYLIEAEGKCPATTGCGPTSAANAAAIVALHNTYPDLRAHIDAQAATIAANTEREIHLTYVLKGLLGAYEAIVRQTGKDDLLRDDAPTWRNTARTTLLALAERAASLRAIAGSIVE